MAFIFIPDGLPSLSVLNITNASASILRSVQRAINVFPLYGNNSPLNFGDLLDAPWPEVDPGALTRDEIEMMLQVNGKLRGSIKVSSQATKEEIEKIALDSEAYKNQAKGANPKKIIVVAGRLVNIVL